MDNIRLITKYVVIFVAAIILSACGDKCFQDVTFPTTGSPYLQKTAQITIPANSSTFISTEQINTVIPSGTEVLINITGGPVFLCGQDQGVFSISATTSTWTEVLSPGLVPNQATVIGDSVTFFVGCDPDDAVPACNTVSCQPNINSINCAQTTVSCSPLATTVDCSQTPGNALCNGSATAIIPACTKCQSANAIDCSQTPQAVLCNGSTTKTIPAGTQCTYTGVSGDQCINNCTQQIMGASLCQGSTTKTIPACIQCYQSTGQQCTYTGVSGAMCTTGFNSINCSQSPGNVLCQGSTTAVIPTCSQYYQSTGQQCTYTGVSGAMCTTGSSSINCSQTPGNVLCQGSNTAVIPTCSQYYQGSKSCFYKGVSGDQCINNCTQQICASPNQQYYQNSSCTQQYSSGQYTTSLNQWNWVNNTGAVNTFCQIQHYSKAFLPTVTAAYLYQYISDGKNNNASNNCWYTAGMGMAMKVVIDTEAQGCEHESLTNVVTWFINNPVSVVGGQIQGEGNDFTIVRCPGSGNIGFQDCSNNLLNTNVQRVIENTVAKFYCVKLIDAKGDYGDNLGGYNVQMKAKRCVAQDGYPLTTGSTTTPTIPSGTNPLGVLEMQIINSATPNVEGTSTPVVSLDAKNSDGTAWVAPNAIYYETDKMEADSYLSFRVKDSFYPDNIGSYTVNLSWHEDVGGSGTISRAIQELREDLRNIVLTKLPQFYCQSTCTTGTCTDSQGVCTSPYIQYIRAILVFYIISYGFAFVMGFAEISQKDLLIRALKIGLVLQLISPGSWNFFNDTLFSLFLNGTDELIHFATMTPCPNGQCPPVFSFVDNMFDLLFLDKAVWMKILSVLFISPSTLVLGVLLIIGLFYFMMGIFAAVVEYLLSIIAVAALLLLGPVFIPFILFEQTRSMFDTWIKMLFRYSMEPVFLLIGLSFLFEVYYALFREMFNYTACWKCMWGMDFPSSLENVINKIFHISGAFLCVQGFGPWGMAPSGGGALSGALGIDLPALLLIVVLSAVVRNYTTFVASVMTKLIGQRSSIWKMTGGKRQKFGSAGEAALDSLGIGKAEKAVNKAVRKGVFKTLGLKTGDKEEKDKELEQYENNLAARKSKSNNNNPSGNQGGTGSSSVTPPGTSQGNTGSTPTVNQGATGASSGVVNKGAPRSGGSSGTLQGTPQSNTGSTPTGNQGGTGGSSGTLQGTPQSNTGSTPSGSQGGTGGSSTPQGAPQSKTGGTTTGSQGGTGGSSTPQGAPQSKTGGTTPRTPRGGAT